MINLLIPLLSFAYTFYAQSNQQVLVPVDLPDRQALHLMQITSIGQFGLERKERPEVPRHLHTGIDIVRPNPNFLEEPIYPMAEGIVISIRDDGPFAQVILEHMIDNQFYWSVYEHIAGISVDLHQTVGVRTPIARFMNKSELDRYGWQFDHFHFEILRRAPLQLKPSPDAPERHFSSYTLSCFTEDELNHYFYDPYQFFQSFF